MGIHIRFGLSGAALAAALLLPPALSSAQTRSGNSAATPGMASPSNEANIPKGSNPESGSGNLAPGSGDTPSSSAADESAPGQTSDNPQSSVNDSRPNQTATDPNQGRSGGGDQSTSHGESVPQGKYTSPPNVDAE